MRASDRFPMHDPTLWAGGQKLTLFWAYLHQFSSAGGKLGRKQIGFAEADLFAATDLFARELRSSKQKLRELCPKIWKLLPNPLEVSKSTV